MTELRRDWLIRVGQGGATALQFRDLDCAFKVTRTMRAEPNTCSLTVYGPGEDSRKAIEGLNIYDPRKEKSASAKATYRDAKLKRPTTIVRAPKLGHIRVEIEAGYVGQRGLVFSGDLRRGITKRDGAEISIEIEGEDGGRTILESRINMSFPAGTRKIDVVAECAKSLGLGSGNLLQVADRLTGIYPHGTSLNGPAATLLSGLLRGAGIGWSVQSGSLQFANAGAGAGLRTHAVLLTSETGLIGSPQRDATGAVMIRCMMLPGLAPGGYVRLQSKDFTDNYYIKAMTTEGATFGDAPWGHELECYPG